MFCATFSKGRWQPSCIAKLQKKKSKWLNAKIIVTQSWYNSIERFFQFYTLLFLVRDAILTGLFLINFKTAHCKNHFDTNLVKIHEAVIEILSFSCSVLFLVTANDRHLGMPKCKKSKRLYTRNTGIKLDQFQPMVVEISSFSCLCYF